MREDKRIQKTSQKCKFSSTISYGIKKLGGHEINRPKCLTLGNIVLESSLQELKLSEMKFYVCEVCMQTKKFSAAVPACRYATAVPAFRYATAVPAPATLRLC